ncbi:uncharacterized protein LOC105702882 isoform X2 [Orussus abietinus]|uniref:uncharacterized protein LOC105702882 isoform X2 n=1 Tax=Orussus abietinus TaxID=222816 RepID=UPI000625A3E1|nr:uncharacterized protein LOC105702882 isoform X2 [Orussus abietinus]
MLAIGHEFEVIRNMNSTADAFAADILQLLPVDEWFTLRDTLKENWPTYAYHYYWVENAIQWKKQNPNIKHDIYCPEGKLSTGVFIGISTFSGFRVYPFATGSSQNLLHKSLLESQRLDWNTADLKSQRGLEIDFSIPGQYYFKSVEECATVKIQIPEECYVMRLNKSHVSQILAIWPHRHATRPELSMAYLQLLVEMNTSVGLFLRKNDALVSWVLQNEWGGLGMVQTIEEYKRRGYAKTVVKVLAKEIADFGLSSVLFIVKGNASSHEMFTSLNWKRMNDILWIVMKEYETRT